MERINNNIPYTVLLIFSISVHKKFKKKGKKGFTDLAVQQWSVSVQVSRNFSDLINEDY